MRRRMYPLVVAAGLAAAALIPTHSTSAASANASARRQMNTVLPEVKLSGVALADALDFLRDVSGVNLTINWKALEQAGIAKDTPINVRLHAISLRKALDLILAEASGSEPLTYDLDEGVVEITTKALADARMYTKVYPIDDLIMDIPDFTDAPSFDLSSLSNQTQQQGGAGGGVGGGVGGGAGGGGSSGGQQGIFGGSSGSGGNQNREAPGRSKQERANDLVELIRAVIQPDVWQENGGKATIRFYSGSLIITAPRAVHEAIGGPLD
ncbi:MAG TPA: hypothetical protein VH370_03110 [Humisphaera sp.]|nr:hypothetical protein [Humisphaera sp.]